MAYSGIKAQLYDAQWVLGDFTSILDFRTVDSVLVDSVPVQMSTTITVANICDEVGNILYCSNGIYIADKDGNRILNGSNLNPCQYTIDNSIIGLNIPQAALFIPMPGNLRYYYLFHFSYDTLNSQRPGTMYYSLIDKDGNSGLGEVIAKNIPILKNVVLRAGGMTACKHANGRDYWIIMGGSDNNKFYKFLVTRDSIFGPVVQNIGPPFLLPNDLAYSKFSQDGSKYSTGIGAGPVLIMDFDRCSGMFSGPQTIFNEASTDPVHHPLSGCTGVEFSPNGQYLYVSGVTDMNQYDLLSGNIQDSVEVYRADSTDAALVDEVQLAPNGKLYADTWNGVGEFIHVVNYPDLKGDSCDFVWGGQPTLSINSNNLPNLINYKLGPLIGSGCDTINTDIRQQTTDDRLIRIQPNPANKYAYVEVGMQGDYEMQLLNETGQLITTKQTRQVDIFDTEHLASGVYFIKVIDKRNGSKALSKRLVVVH